jgi:WD40 repeat protein
MTTEEGGYGITFSPSGHFVGLPFPSRTEIWPLDSPPAAQAQVLRGGEDVQYALAFDPEDEWYAATTPILGDRVTLVMWPLTRPLPYVLRGHNETITALRFTPDGRSLLSSSTEGKALRWELDAAAGTPGVETLLAEPHGLGIAADTRCQTILAVGAVIKIVTLDGAPPRSLPGWELGMRSLGISPKGKTAVIGGGFLKLAPGLKAWDVATGEVRVVDSGDGEFFADIAFLSEDRFVTTGDRGLRSWNLSTGQHEVLRAGKSGSVDPSPDGRRLLVIDSRSLSADQGDFELGSAMIYDLETRAERHLVAHGGEVTSAAFGPGGEIVVTGSRSGEVRVGPASGEAPHLLLSDDALVGAVAVSPDGRWIASGDANGVIRLWPMPAGRPLHELPTEEFRRELGRLTNLRMVADASSENGYRLDVAPYTDWTAAPTW